MPGQIASFEPKFLLLGIEANEGAGAAVTLSSTSVIVTENAKAEIGVGDTRVLKRDGSNPLDQPEETSNLQNKIIFDTPFAYPEVPGTAGPLDEMLRACGLDPVYDPVLKTTTYTPSALDAIDTVHGSIRGDESDGNHIEYPSKGMRGSFDISIVIGEQIYLKNVGLEGSYIRPDELVAITEDFGTSQDNINANVTAKTINTWMLDGKSLCAQSLDIKNASGIKLNKSNMSCGDSVIAEKVNPMLTVTYRKPGFVAEFNPYELGESHETIKKVPFVVEINSPGAGKIKIELLVQPKIPKRVQLKDKSTGFSQEMKGLEITKIITYEADAV